MRALAVPLDGKFIYSGGDDTTIRKWRSLDGHCVGVFRGHDLPVWALALSRDGLTLYSGSEDNTIRCWQPADGDCTAAFTGHSGAVRTLALSKDGLSLVRWVDRQPTPPQRDWPLILSDSDPLVHFDH